MNLEEAMKLKGELLNAQQYVQGHIDGVGDDYIKFEFDENVHTKSQIISSINTEEAIRYLEYCIKQYLNYFATQGISLDKLSIELFTEFYMMHQEANRADEDYKIKNLYSKAFLEDIVNLSLNINITSNGEDISHKIPLELEKLQHIKEMVVNYNEFVKRLKELGYELNYQTFAELLAGEYKGKPAMIDNVESVELGEKTSRRK